MNAYVVRRAKYFSDIYHFLKYVLIKLLHLNYIKNPRKMEKKNSKRNFISSIT